LSSTTEPEPPLDSDEKEGHLSIFFSDGGKTIEIYGNGEGLEALVHRLKTLIQSGKGIELKTPSSGGRGLSEETACVKTNQVQKVRIHRINHA